MDFNGAINACFSKYALFEGRSPRSEFWYFQLFLFLMGLLMLIIDIGILESPIIRPANLILTLVTFLPSLAVYVRRLHDVNRSGLWILLWFTFIGIPVLLYWGVKPSDSGKNDYGDPPPLSDTPLH